MLQLVLSSALWQTDGLRRRVVVLTVFAARPRRVFLERGSTRVARRSGLKKVISWIFPEKIG